MAALKARWTIAALALAAAGCAHAPVGGAQEAGVRVECPGDAVSAFVLGSFDGWRRPGAALARSGGRFASSLELPPGPALLVCELHRADGSVAVVPPTNAEAVVDDGFGGKNGLFDVPGKQPRGGAL